MQTPLPRHDHRALSSSASHDVSTQMVSKHCSSFVRLGGKPLYHFATTPQNKHGYPLRHHLDGSLIQE